MKKRLHFVIHPELVKSLGFFDLSERYSLFIGTVFANDAWNGKYFQFIAPHTPKGISKMAWTIKKPILVPFDFSKHSHAAVDKALEMTDDKTLIHVLHVLPTFIALAPGGFPIEAVDDQVRIDYARKLLEGEFQDTCYAGVVREVLVGDPGTVCSERAETLDAELIVLPSHGRSGLSRLLLGSVTERIVRLAGRPVLVLKL